MTRRNDMGQSGMDDFLNPEMSEMFSGRLHGQSERKEQWAIAQEMPLVIFYNSMQFGVMMMTPAHFEEFAIGFSLNEGIVSSIDQISDIRLEALGEGMAVNILVPHKALEIAKSRKRTISGGTSCGICGAQTIEIALPHLKKTHGLKPDPNIALKALLDLPDNQKMRKQNFSTHGAALANAKGDIILLREDVGRHNSVDKLYGAMVQASLTAKDGFLVLSSRYSIELAQKAAAAGFSFVASVSAPTSLALKASKQANMTIATFFGNEIMVFE